MALRIPDDRSNRAGYAGTCGACGGKFAAGEWIVRLPGNTRAAYGHARCPIEKSTYAAPLTGERAAKAAELVRRARAKREPLGESCTPWDGERLPRASAAPQMPSAAPRASSAADWIFNAATRTATTEMSTLMWSEFPPAIALKAVAKPVTNILRQTSIERDADGDILKVEYHCATSGLHAIIFND